MLILFFSAIAVIRIGVAKGVIGGMSLLTLNAGKICKSKKYLNIFPQKY